jgi:N-acetylglucosaminyldiphosphoundecaprenol N-acetyl-beta-D-mannosaminyltransferase
MIRPGSPDESPRLSPASPSLSASIDTVEISRGLTVHRLTEAQCVQRIIGAVAAGQGGWVLTPNLDILRQCRRQPELRAILERADLRVADGMPLIWASRLAGDPLPERVAGSSLILSLSRAAGQTGRSVYLLGGEPGTAEAAAEVLQERSPGLRIAGCHCPPFGFEHDPAQWDEMDRRLRASGPDIVFVGLGFPKQERLIQRLRPSLPEAWWLGVGISFSFLSGKVRRAPRWVQRAGLEWAHRLVQEPRRLFRRYLVHGLPFAAVLMGEALVRRMRAGRNG